MRKNALNPSDQELLDELYRNSYRVVLSRAANRLGNYDQAEDLLSQVYLKLIPRLDKLRRLDLKSRVAYTVAISRRLCDEILERREKQEACRYSYRGYELNDLRAIEGVDDEGKQILTERLDVFRYALESLPSDEQSRLKRHVITGEAASDKGVVPDIDETALSIVAKLSELEEQEMRP